MLRLLAYTLTVGTAALTASAQTQDGVDELADALGLDDVIEIMAQEGRVYGSELEQEMFPGRGGGAWNDWVGELYDKEGMRVTVLDAFARELEDTDLDPLIAFFTSELGREIITLEVEARRALLDDEVEELAERRYADMLGTQDPRLDLLEGYVETNDLIEQNVVGAMNSNYAFYVGLMDGGAFGPEVTEDQVLRDVWSQEAEIRTDTTQWLFSYLNLAYQPLEDAEIETYIALSSTPEGKAMNDALFSAFDQMYVGISRGLGEGAARFLSGQDI